MRGTRLPCKLLSVGNGIIPAYAGNTIRISQKPLTGRDHPRVCGEHKRRVILAVRAGGSSPRMRGTPDHFGSARWRYGIIPAYAGNTCLSSLRRFATGDHPRVCGEHEFTDCTMAKYGGSSPRMRGTHMFGIGGAGGKGIIPAYAGNTGLLVCPCANGGDHPRVCGEHQKLSLCRHVLAGSSPRMRGTPVRVRQW